MGTVPHCMQPSPDGSLNLNVCNIAGRWPLCWTPAKKSFRVETCSELLAIYSANWDNILSRTVTGDDQESITGILSPNSSRCTGSTPTHCHPRSFALSRRIEVMGTFFLDCKGLLLVDYLPHKTTMTGPYYSELLKKNCSGLGLGLGSLRNSFVWLVRPKRSVNYLNWAV